RSWHTALFEGVGERLHDLVLLRLRQAENFSKRDADVRNVRLDVGALLLRLGQALAVAQEAAQPAADFLKTEAQLADDLGIGGDRLLALGGERHPDAGD